MQQPANIRASTTHSTQLQPPPYAAVDPTRSAAYNPTTVRVQQASTKVVPVLETTNPIQKNCVACRGFHADVSCPVQAKYANNPFPAGVPYKKAPPIPPLPKAPKASNPYKWSQEQHPSSHPSLNISVNHSTTQQNKKPSPSSTPSPNYDPLHNPYVWVNEQPQPATKNAKLIDLDKELPRIYERMKENKLPNFQELNKQLSKNKPLSEVRNKLVNNKYLSDVTFIVGGSPFYGHKMILITSSFLFYERFFVKGETEMMVDSIDFETFQKVIAYCYTDQIKVTEDNVLDLLLAANKLQVRQITNVCHGFISNFMNQESVFIIFEKALELENESFQKKCLDYINKNEEKCFTSKGFFSIPLPSLIKILGACNYPQEKIEQITMKYMAGSMEAPFQEPNEVAPPKKTQKTKGTKQTPKPKGSIGNIPGKQKIPDLMSLPIPSPQTGPPLISPFPYPLPNGASYGPRYAPPHMHSPMHHPHMQPPHMSHPIRPFHGSYQGIPFPSHNGPLINIDDDDDRASIISKDDDHQAKVKVNVLGSRHQWNTEFSRLDFICKRSMLLHEIWFSEDLAKTCKSVDFTIGVFENNQRRDISKRSVKINKGESYIGNNLHNLRY